MAPQLWLLRHGEAVPHDSKPDHERELTPRGRTQAELAGAALAKLGLEFAACYTSPKLRALETARLACRSLNVEPSVARSLAGRFDREDALELLSVHGADDRVLAVGHEPTFSQVVHDFTGSRLDFKKGGVAGLRAERAGGELLVLLRPRELEAIAG
ncbi:SixA phosphatase family protein [Candidatus Solirubrobacter pratensis]|uniref:SixA phosphatase family protein n=1 Tax=Candidatus Solirubrobacter pratensis TaxID=1298857 RepID=UPI00042402B7|nr:histidine phosphatase family protein [Candidatus Solirubrobacter pratensis]